MNTQSRIKVFIALLTILVTNSSYAKWQTLEPGLFYQDLAPSLIHDWSHIHTFKIDLRRFKFELIQQHQTEKTYPSISQYAAIHQSPLTFNGGFFDDKQHPLGLRISNYRPLNPLKTITWWGVFYIQQHRAHICSAREFQLQKDIEFAIQSGPRLIIHDHIPKLHPGYAERTALCVLANQQVIVLITQYHPMTLNQLAILLQTPPLACHQAINLDGGSSTQFLAKLAGFYRHMPGLSAVSDAITIIPRQ